MSTFPFYKQPDYKDCGPTCLRIIAKHYGKLISIQEIRKLSETTRSGSNLLKLSDGAEAIGFKTIGARLDFKKLEQAQLSLIVHWNNNHFVVVYRIYKGRVYLSDPGYGLIFHKVGRYLD